MKKFDDYAQMSIVNKHKMNKLYDKMKQSCKKQNKLT